MDTSLSALSSLFNFYVFPTGRRVFALGQVAAIAKASGHSDLAKHCNAAVAEDRKCLAAERKWAGYVAEMRGKVAAVPRAGSLEAKKKVDALVDRTLTAIRDNADNMRAGAPDDDPIHGMVLGFQKEIFPSGLQAVTGLPFVEELAAVEDILDKLASPTVAPIVEELHLGKLVERLKEVTKKYRAVLVPAPKGMSFDEVRRARSEGQDRLLHAVSMIVCKHPASTAKDVEARAALLEPILAQNAAIGATMRTRATVTDVNPETGEPSDVPVDATPSNGAAPAAQPSDKPNG